MNNSGERQEPWRTPVSMFLLTFILYIYILLKFVNFNDKVSIFKERFDGVDKLTGDIQRDQF